MYGQLRLMVGSLLLTTLCLTINAAEKYDLYSALKAVDEAVMQRHDRYNDRAAQIDSLTKALNNRAKTTEDQLSAYETIGDEYSLFNNDSAIIYYTRGLNSALEYSNDSLLKVFQLKLASHLPIAGLSYQGIRHFESVDTTGMSDKLKLLYFESGRRMNYFVSVFFEINKDEREVWYSKVTEYQRNILKYLDPETPIYNKYLGEYYFLMNEPGKAWKILTELLPTLDPDSDIYASTATVIARIAKERDDNDAREYYLALAAKAGIESATREITALHDLAALLYEKDDIYRSYEYMSTALENATDSHAVARITQISPQLTIISDAHNRLMDWWNRTYSIIIGILGICIVIIIIIVYFLWQHVKSMREMQGILSKANNTKEVYISQFMVLCSVYMDKLQQFNNLVNRKLSAGQAEELYRLTKNGKLIEEQTKDFYDVFDNAFLHIYPNFINDINSLLMPDEQIVLKEGEKLNTDLRILACMRLGLEDANRVAQILNYSVNTIYAYRNRLKNRAINRDTFEADVMSVGS